MHSITLQRLGQTMESGRIERWLKDEGDSFEAGDPLYEVETDKVTVEVNAYAAGTLARIVVPAAGEVEVGRIVAVVADPGESWTEDEVSALLSANDGPTLPAAEQRAPADAPVAVSSGTGARTPVMPRARMLADELGVDLASIQGTGEAGTVTVADVRGAGGAVENRGARIRERKPLTGPARRMAAVVAESWRTVPQFVQHVEVSAEGLLRRRAAEAGAVDAEPLTVGDLLLSAVVGAVARVPAINASLGDDEVIVYDDVNVALAVSTESGLHVPVVKRAQDLDLAGLSRTSRELAEKARAGALALEDVEGGTITFSNLGKAGVDLGTPLVTAPQAAIVFAGIIRNVPAFEDGEIKPVSKLWLSGAFDHRIIDGALAAEFMSALKEHIEAL